MKSTGKHPDRALTAVRVRNLATPGRYADGGGLYLVVEPNGAKRWLLRIVVQRRRRDIGLGGVALVSLAEARERALSYRKLAREGRDPFEARRKAALIVPTFATAANIVHAEHKATWKNAKHAAQWFQTLQTYAVPIIGSLRVDQIATPDVLRVLAPIWLTRPETARRVRQRMGAILDWGKAAGYRSSDNPVEGVERGLPKQLDRANHPAVLPSCRPAVLPSCRPAVLPYSDVPAFVTRLRSCDANAITKLAFEFLTAGRTGEVLGASWPEIDVAASLWTIPAARMKAQRPHRVPLTKRCMEILAQAKAFGGGSDLVFPGQSGTKQLSNMTLLMTLRRLGVSSTARGFRSSLRDWAAETTNFPQHVAEMALAHSVGNTVEAAYRRGDLLAKRRELMESWSAYSGGLSDAEFDTLKAEALSRGRSTT